MHLSAMEKIGLKYTILVQYDTYRDNLIDYREFRREEVRLNIKQKKEHRKSVLVDCFISNLK